MSIFVYLFLSIYIRDETSRKFSNPLCTTIRWIFFSRHFGNKFRSKFRVIALCSAIPNSYIYTPMCSKRVLHYVSTHLHNIWTFPLVFHYYSGKNSGSLIFFCRLVPRPFPLSEAHYICLFYTRTI